MQIFHIYKAALFSIYFIFCGAIYGLAADNSFVERIKKQNLPSLKTKNTKLVKIQPLGILNNIPKANLFAMATAGNAEAQYIMAIKYRDGATGYLTNQERYLYWLTEASAAGHAHAQFELGAIYLDGMIVPQNLSSGVALLIKSANAGDVDGQEKLAYAIENGLGVVKDIKNAIAWYEFAAEKFDPKNELARAGAVAKLISVYFDGELTEPNYAKVYKYASLLAQRPLDWYGHTHLAQLLENGLGVPKNERLALQHYLIALQNNTDIHNVYGRNQALYLVGMMYLDGRGTASNVVTAATYFKLDHGNPKSASQLLKLNGLQLNPQNIKPTSKLAPPNKLFDKTKPTLSIHSNGKSALVPLGELLPPQKNYNILTIEEMLTDVAANNVDAQYYLGQLYLSGKRDLAKNKELSNKFLELAAQQGHAQAQSYVAAYYLDQNDHQTAMFWLDKSLAANNPNAQVVKGLLYQRGVGVKRNIQTAMIWFDKAAQQLDPYAEEPLILPITRLIWHYFDGIDAPKDYQQVEKYALMLNEIPTDAVGKLYLGLLYENGWLSRLISFKASAARLLVLSSLK